MHTQLIFMDQIDEVSPECIPVKGEPCIILRKKGYETASEKDAKVVLTTSVSTLFDYSFLMFIIASQSY